MERLGRWVRTTEFSLAAIFTVGFVLLAITSGGTLLSHLSLSSFMIYLGVPILIGLGQMMVLSVRQMNLAIGAMGGVACAVMAVSMAQWGWPMPIALAVGFAVAVGLGALNGALVVITRLNGLVITLATMTILIGVQYLLVSAFTVDQYPQELKEFKLEGIGPISYIFLGALVVAAIVSWFFRRMAVGRRILATGGNPTAATLSGISNDRSVFLAHTLSGVLVGCAAIVTMASLPGINRSVGGDWLLPSFAAPIIGGVSLAGGNVAILGTVLAAAVIRLIDVARVQFLLDASTVSFAVGAVVLGTVVLSEARGRRAAQKAQEAALRASLAEVAADARS
ncbi:MAG: ABC transporter permease [Chloroflexota bacterium]